MIEVVKSATFDRWLRRAEGSTCGRARAGQDRPARLRNPGDVRPVGSGVSELRIDYGPGYRVYYLQDGQLLIVLLCGGSKSGQDRDIEEAQRLADKCRSHERHG